MKSLIEQVKAQIGTNQTMLELIKELGQESVCRDTIGYGGEPLSPCGECIVCEVQKLASEINEQEKNAAVNDFKQWLLGRGISSDHFKWIGWSDSEGKIVAGSKLIRLALGEYHSRYEVERI